jgi:hypothetical protein
MYQVLIDGLRDNLLYFDEEIKDFHQTSCSLCAIRALDFVKIKTEFYRLTGEPVPKSVNALIIRNNQIYFIEMTSYYLTYPYTLENFRQVHSEENGIIKKILGTIKGIIDIAEHYSLNESFRVFFSNPSLRRIKTVLLTEMNAHDYLMMRIGNLDKFNVPLLDSLEGEIAIFNCEQFENFFG